MRKKILTVFLAITVTVSLFACGGSESTPAPVPVMEQAPAEEISMGTTSDEAAAINEVYDEGYYTTDELIDMLSSGEITIEILESMVASGEVNYEVYEEVLSIYEAIKPVSNFWDYPELNNITRDMVITNAISFSEGVAWITVNNAHAMLINTSGEVLYYYHSDHMNTVKYSGFFQGVSLFENGATGDTFLIDTSGNVVWSKKNGISDIEAIYGVGSVESIEITYPAEFNGYLVETVYVNTFEKTCYLSAIIKPDGTWLFEPLEDNPIRLEKCYCRYSDTDKNPKIDFIILSSRKFVVLHYSALWGIVGGHCTLKAL